MDLIAYIYPDKNVEQKGFLQEEILGRELSMKSNSL